MSTKQKLTKEQKALEKKLLCVVLYYKNLNGESVRDLHSLYGLSVGTVSTRIKEGKGVVALEPELTLEDAQHMLLQVYAGNTESPKPAQVVTPQQLAIHAVYAEAVKPTGVNNKTEYALYGKIFGYSKEGACNITAQQKSYIRRRVREIAKVKGETVVFVPDWINPKAPQRSIDTMAVMANEMFQRMEEMVNQYLADNNLPESAKYAVKQALAGMVVEGVSPMSVERQCKGYTDVVVALTANGAATEEQEVFDYAKAWNNGIHETTIIGAAGWGSKITTPAEVHAVFESFKDLDEEGYIY